MRIFFFLALLLSAGCRDFAVDGQGEEGVAGRRLRTFDVEANVPFEMGVGDQAVLDEGAVIVTFAMVLEDERCPDESLCGAPGKAGILLDVFRNVGNENQIVLHIPGRVPTPYTVNSFVQQDDIRLQLQRLIPAPGSSGAGRDPYVATLLIDR